MSSKARANVTSSTETSKRKVDSVTGNAAKKLFLAKYDNPPSPTRTIRTGGSSVPTVAVEGIVLRTKTVHAVGKKPGTTVPKIEVTVEVQKVRHNSAPDAVVSGVPGFEWLLPTFKPKGDARDAADDSPEHTNPTKELSKEMPRTLALTSANHKTIWLGNFGRVQFYTTSAKDEIKKGSDLIVPGMQVEVTGVVANASADGNALFLNAANCNPMLSSFAPSAASEMTITALKSAGAMSAAATRLSSTMHGFFGTSLPPAHEEQAQVFRDRWVAARDGTIAACEAKAAYIRSDKSTDGEPAAQVLDAHAARLRESKPEDLACGSKSFFVAAMPVTPDRPAFTASITHRIAHMEYPQSAMLHDLYDDTAHVRLPETFVAIDVNDTEIFGATINIKMRLTFIGSKIAAREAILRNLDPTLDTGRGAALGTKFNLRDLPEITGVLVENKAHGICSHIFKFGEWAAVVGVTPREPSDEGVVCPFANGYAIDMPKSLANIAVRVNETFVVEHLAGGATQYVYEHDPDVVVLKDKEQQPLNKQLPQLRAHGYAEISGSSFKFANAKMPVDKPNKDYRIWWAGVPELAMDDSDILSSAVSGEKALVEASTKAGASTVGEFLLQYCCVYCVAVA